MKVGTCILNVPLIVFLLFSGILKSQVLSTAFIDTVEISVNHNMIYASHETLLTCVSKDRAIPLYSDGVYKLMIVPVPHMTYGDVVNFYRNDTLLPLEGKSRWNAYESCRQTESYSFVFEYCKPGEEMSPHILIRLHYRSTHFLPEDTAHYRLNYREGVWLQHSTFDGEIRVTYHNDEKHGPASILGHDSILYQVNFQHNFTENHSTVKATDLRTGYRPLKYRSSFDVLESCYSPQTNTYPSFSFVKKHRSRQIESGELLSVYYDKKGLTHDSISYNVKGEFLELIRDTMIIGVEDLYVHDFYKRYTDSLHAFYVRKPEPFVKVPLKDITKIYKDRNLVTPMFLTAGLAFASALLVAPLVSLQKDGFNTDRYATVSLSSLGVMTATITTGIIFGQKKYMMKRGIKNRRTWKIRMEE